ncbi:hypothetical protein JCM8547_000799 [Rhodosporidiobolus lusitaniae]
MYKSEAAGEEDLKVEEEEDRDEEVVAEESKPPKNLSDSPKQSYALAPAEKASPRLPLPPPPASDSPPPTLPVPPSLAAPILPIPPAIWTFEETGALLSTISTLTINRNWEDIHKRASKIYTTVEGKPWTKTAEDVRLKWVFCGSFLGHSFAAYPALHTILAHETQRLDKAIADFEAFSASPPAHMSSPHPFAGAAPSQVPPTSAGLLQAHASHSLPMQQQQSFPSQPLHFSMPSQPPLPRPPSNLVASSSFSTFPSKPLHSSPPQQAAPLPYSTSLSASRSYQADPSSSFSSSSFGRRPSTVESIFSSPLKQVSTIPYLSPSLEAPSAAQPFSQPTRPPTAFLPSSQQPFQTEYRPLPHAPLSGVHEARYPQHEADYGRVEGLTSRPGDKKDDPSSAVKSLDFAHLEAFPSGTSTSAFLPQPSQEPLLSRTSALPTLDIPVKPLPPSSSTSKKLPASPKSATSATSSSSSRRPAAPKRGRKPSFTLEIDQPAAAKKPSSSSSAPDSRSLRKRSKSVSYVEPTVSSESTDEEDEVEPERAGGGKEGRKGRKAPGKGKKEESEDEWEGDEEEEDDASSFVPLVTLTFAAICAGFYQLYFRPAKWLMFFGLLVRLFGISLMIKSRGARGSTGFLILTQVLQSLGEGVASASSQLLAQASVPHQDVATVTAFVLLFADIGTAVGSTIACTIWRDHMPSQLAEHFVGILNDTEISTMYGSVYLAAGYRGVNDAAYDGIIASYSYVTKILLIASTTIAVIPPLLVLGIKNIKLTEAHNAVENEGLDGRPLDEKRVDV